MPNLIYTVYNFILNILDSKISILELKSFKKNPYLCGRFRNIKNAMQQNRMNILTTSIRGNKCFEGMSYVHTLSIESIGLTFQQTYKSIEI